MNRRRAGVLVPLFSLCSRQGWGIGEVGDLAAAARWLGAAGQQVLQILPISELPHSETSPYSALSAMAIDPMFITMSQVEDLAGLGSEALADAEDQTRLEAVRHSSRVEYAGVRALKHVALRRAFERFLQVEWAHRTARAGAFAEYVARQRWWLDDYSLFRALHARYGERPWMEWPEPLRDRTPQALAEARTELADDVRYRQYLQWVVETQWHEARRLAGALRVFGDLPFMVARDSADVWARRHEFRHDASAGVPPDAFSEVGQDWNLPVYRWDIIARGGFQWLRDRARRNASLFDGYRIDHLVGFYRSYFRPHDGSAPAFTPADESAQIALGEQVLAIFREAGAEVTAEDLGLVPDFVRESLARLGIPGYKVLRWERRWREPGQPFIDPVDYGACTVATSGTHDTEPMAVWWETARRDERSAVLEIPSVQRGLTGSERVLALEASTLTSPMRDALISALYAAGSDLVILPVQDLFGWRARINTPATVSDENWTWKLPWPVDALVESPDARAAAERLRTMAHDALR